MNWRGHFREGLAREIRENKTLPKNNSLYSIVQSLARKSRGFARVSLTCLPENGHLKNWGGGGGGGGGTPAPYPPHLPASFSYGHRHPCVLSFVSIVMWKGIILHINGIIVRFCNFYFCTLEEKNEFVHSCVKFIFMLL